MRRILPLPIILVLVLAGCHHRAPKPHPKVSPSASAPSAPIGVLIIAEDGDPVSRSAHQLAALIAHFDERSALIAASDYAAGRIAAYRCAFYLAGSAKSPARAAFAADLPKYTGTAVWVGPGVSALGKAAVDHLGLSGSDSSSEPQPWLLSYGGQQHQDEVAVPPVGYRPGRTVLSVAAEPTSSSRRHPFLTGSGKLWYAAAGPLPGSGHFWSRCIWADALHDIMAVSHRRQRLLVPVLRDVPVWASSQQVLKVIRPLLTSGVPVSVMAQARTGDVLLSDRPSAARGLRDAEALGATITLAGDARSSARDQLRMAWEMGVRPLAWAGPAGDDSPFRLRLADLGDSPPYSAGGLLPVPVTISDAGYISSDDSDRLRQLAVVRDGVTLASFGLWAPPDPFLKFLNAQRSNGWKPTDMRTLNALVSDPRRTLASGSARVLLPGGGKLRRTVLGPRWERVSEDILTTDPGQGSEQSVNAPDRSVVVLEPIRDLPSAPFLTGVTLDPWAYTGQGVSAATLAEALAERYSRNGVNTVFFYAYNVEEGAAYRTRYHGASVSEWGQQDLLGHLLESCRARGIRVVAWLYSGRDKGVWTQHPEWRERTADGKEYNPLRLHATYFLCPRNAEVRRWYSSLVQDLAHRYPTLSGVELCEPLVNWWGNQACYCDVCRREFAKAYPNRQQGGPEWKQFRAQGLTEFLSQCLGAVSAEGIDTYIMTITDAWSNGAILSPRRQADESGLDIDALLDTEHAPDWVNFELIWQQWAAIYGTEVFNSTWAAEIGQQLVRRVDGRSKIVFHVELTDFGSQHMTPAKIADTISRVSVAKPDGIECYHSGAIDSKAAWTVLKQSFESLR